MGKNFGLIWFFLFVTDPEEFPNLMDGELPDVAPPVFTEETLALSTSYVKETGENFRLTCEALGKPEPEVIWYQNQVEYRPDGRYTSRSGPVYKGKAILVLRLDSA